MKTRRINADKPHLWKADIAASVDRFNQWFMEFAPEAFRSTRIKTTEHIKAALKRFLTDCVKLLRVHRFDAEDVQFGDALVSSVVLVLHKAPPPRGHTVEFTFGGTMIQPHAKESVTLERLRDSHKWTVFEHTCKPPRRWGSKTVISSESARRGTGRSNACLHPSFAHTWVEVLRKSSRFALRNTTHLMGSVNLWVRLGACATTTRSRGPISATARATAWTSS